MFSAMCQGCHSLRELKKELICAEKELLDPPGMAARTGSTEADAKPSCCQRVWASLFFKGSEERALHSHACGGQWVGKQAESGQQ